jgi:NitT/TauT family transport system ATP-binding protein
MPPLLSVRDVTLQYRLNDRVITAAWNVSFEVERHDRFILLGPSGCGKSTLLKALGGFIAPVSGRIDLDGRPVGPPGPDRMMVFQEFDQLLPWKSVLANVAFPMITSGRFARAEALDRARGALDKVGLEAVADRYPHTLSGGMKQRVAIARALAPEPAILLMDEPFAALDALNRLRLQEELETLWRAQPFTMVFVTHAIDEAVALGNRILVLSPHPGQVRAEIDAGQWDVASRGQPGFAALEARLRGLLAERETVDA